jgi:2-oxoglutarate dehydrogenase complex dehydrogenase (E1) component-like enzyme
MTNWQGITGVNRAYVLELYDRYLKDPNAVDAGDPCPFRDLDAARGGRTGTGRRSPRPR